MISPLTPGLTSGLPSEIAGNSLTPAQSVKLGREQGRLLIEVSSPPASLPPLKVGDTVLAQINERQPDGKLAAQIKGELFQLMLPEGSKVDGNTLNLRVASTQPLAFALLENPADTTAATAADAGIRNTALAANLRLAAEQAGVDLHTLQQPASKLPPFQNGEWVMAKVAERLPDGSAVVLIKNAAFTLQAPNGDQPLRADPLLLRVRGTEPVIQFRQVDLPNELLDDKSAAVSLSTGSRYLSGLLGNSTPTVDAAVAKAQAPLLADPSSPATHSENQLKQTVEKSGVFYEAHQKAWVNGRLSLDELKQEPQARLAANLELAKTDTAGKPQHLPEMGQLVQRQLDTLEQRQFVFNGQAWPGQNVQWQINPETVDEREGNGSEELRAWNTKLSLQLPALGGLGARLRMVGSQVQLVFDAQNEQAAALIESHREQLAGSMEAAGLMLASLQVKHETDTPG